MKKLLHTLLLFPLMAFGQSQDPCYSLSDYNELTIQANPTLVRDLSPGWNMLGYPCAESTDVVAAFAEITDKIMILKDNNGATYWPEFEFNGIGNLIALEGYLIKLNEQVSGFSFCDGIVLPSAGGCVDCQAINFDPWATTDDGSCNYDTDGINDSDEVEGCTELEACNYNAEATDDDDSCTYPSASHLDCSGACLNDSDSDTICDELEVEGCTDSQACNYNSQATDEDDSCAYPTESYLDCNGACLNDSDSDSVCDELEVEGCTDSQACNYNPEATDDDGSCISVEDPACVYSIYCGDATTGSTADAQNNYGGDAPDQLYKFEVTTSMSYEISTCGSDFDTYLRVYDENMTELYSGDDTGDCSNKTILNVLLDPATYFILVEGYSTASGNYSLSVQNNLSLSGYDCEGNLPPLQVGLEIEAEGGVIFHIDEDERKAYLVSSEDISGFYSWGCEGLEITNTDDAIGSGEANSQTIVDACNTDNCAAYQAIVHVRNGIGDWYLPTISELEKIYQMQAADDFTAESFTALANDYYWSSSEVDLDHAKSFDFYMGAETILRKYVNKPIRPVRVINF